jgi:hypothetical protein
MNSNETFLVVVALLFTSALVGVGLALAKLKPWYCIIASELVLLSMYAAVFYQTLGHSVLLAAHLWGFLPLLAAMLFGYYVGRALRSGQ